MAIASNTGTADGLMLAYKELKAANQPGALNAIVLFTDGQPNGITANFNNTATPAIRSSGTGCVNKTNGGATYNSTSSHAMIGWMAQSGGFVGGGTTNGKGILGLAQNDSSTQNSVTNWLKNGSEPVLAAGGSSATPAYGCSFPGNETTIQTDSKIPAMDFYGNSTTGSATAPYTLTDYHQSEIWAAGGECGSSPVLDLTKSGDACQVGLASWNAADMAGRQIRADATLTPVIYSLGYQGNGGDDPALMRRLANVKIASNTVFDSTKPQGLYLPITGVNDITPAFQYVLAEILRLTL